MAQPKAASFTATPSAARPAWRRHLGPVLAVLVVALAGFLLYRTLGRYSLEQLSNSVAAVPLTRLLSAGGFAALSYLCLTGFDLLATRYVGVRLAYPRVALASFTSLALGHNIGFAALSSGTVRYRFYTRWGLKPEQIAKVILFCGLTVGLGLIALAGIALLAQPGLAQEVLRLPRPAVIALGVVCLALVAGYLALAAVARRPLRWRRWRLEMPRLPLAAAQIVVGTANFACVAACLHQAVAAVAEVSYPAVAAVYVIANVGALVTHVPGGIGVLESVVMFLLPQADLIGALLVFRFVYFLVPLGLGATSLALSELMLRQRGG